MNASFDVVVVGGGVTGAAVGYGLAKRGVKTLLSWTPCRRFPCLARQHGPDLVPVKALGCSQFVRWGFASSAPTASWRRS